MEPIRWNKKGRKSRGRPKKHASYEWFVTELIRQNRSNGAQRLKRLLGTIQHINKWANESVLFPELANHMLSKEERAEAKARFSQKNYDLGGLDGAATLYRCFCNNRTFKRAIGREDLTQIFPSELALLPDAAAEHNYSCNFNLLEQFAMLRFRLQPIFVGVVLPSDRRIGEVGGISQPMVTAYGPNKGPVGETFGLADHIRSVTADLLVESKKRAREEVAIGLGKEWGVDSVVPAARMIGVTTWEYWEEVSLREAIQVLQAESIDGSDRPIQAEPEQRKLGSAAYLQGCLSKAGKQSQIEYYNWLVAELQRSGGEAVLVPALEGICFACSHAALRFFYESLSAKLCGGNKADGAPPKAKGDVSQLTPAQHLLATLDSIAEERNQDRIAGLGEWTKGCEAAQACMWDGRFFASKWRANLDLSSLGLLDRSGATPSEGMRLLRGATETQNKMFNQKMSQALMRFWAQAMVFRSFPDGPMEELVNWHQGIDLASKGFGSHMLATIGAQLRRSGIVPLRQREWPGSQLTEKLSSAVSDAVFTRDSLASRNRKGRGLSQMSNASDQAQSSKLGIQDQSNNVGIAFDNGANNLIKMLTRVDTFWIDENGRVAPLLRRHDTGSAGYKAADGRWAKKFRSYVTHLSAAGLKDALEQFAQFVTNLRNG